MSFFSNSFQKGIFRKSAFHVSFNRHLNRSYSCAYSGFSTDVLLKILIEAKDKTVIPAILNNAVSGGLGVSTPAARHTGALPLVPCTVNGDLPFSVKTLIQPLMRFFEKCSPDSCGNDVPALSSRGDELPNIH